MSETGEENMGVSALYTKGYRMGRRDTEARLAARIEALEAALREIAAYGELPLQNHRPRRTHTGARQMSDYTRTS